MYVCMCKWAKTARGPLDYTTQASFKKVIIDFQTVRNRNEQKQIASWKNTKKIN